MQTNKTIKILVTGSGGFIGMNLMYHFQCQNFINVTGTIRSTTWRKKIFSIPESSFVNIDILEFNKLDELLQNLRPEVIIHAATYGAYTQFENDKEKMTQVNVIGTQELMKLAHKVGVKRFIHLGSSSEYGRSPIPWHEDGILYPQNFYGKTKAMATWSVIHLGKKLGLPSWVIRPFSVYGPGEDLRRIIPEIFLKAITKKEFHLRHPNLKRDFLYVGDLCKFLISLASSQCPPGEGEIFNFTRGEETSFLQLSEMLKDLCGVNVILPIGQETQTTIAKPESHHSWLGLPDKTKNIFDVYPQSSLMEGLESSWIEFQKNIKSYPISL